MTLKPGKTIAQVWTNGASFATFIFLDQTEEAPGGAVRSGCTLTAAQSQLFGKGTPLLTVNWQPTGTQYR